MKSLILAILLVLILTFPVHSEEKITYNAMGVRTGRTVTTGNVQTHYNAQGVRTGKSVITGNRLTAYDSAGKRVGHSITNPQGKTNFDYYGTRSGKQVDDVTYDRLGRRTGSRKLVK